MATFTQEDKLSVVQRTELQHVTRQHEFVTGLYVQPN